MGKSQFPHAMEECRWETRLDRATVIARLQELEGPCRITDSYGRMPVFACEKDGSFRVMSFNSKGGPDGSLYYIRGTVKEEAGRTVVEYAVCRDVVSPRIDLVGSILFAAIVIGVLVFLVLEGVKISQKEWIWIPAAAVVPLLTGCEIYHSRKHREGDTGLMKEAVADRLAAVERWDD